MARKLSTRLLAHVEAEFNPDWAEKAAKLMEEAAGVLIKAEQRKPVAYLGREKRPSAGKTEKGTMLAYPDSPRSARFEWIPIFAE
jgi:hypothetical protein